MQRHMQTPLISPQKGMEDEVRKIYSNLIES